MSCKGGCNQGRWQCPHPWDCDDDDPLAFAIGMRNAMFVTLVAAAIILAAWLAW